MMISLPSCSGAWSAQEFARADFNDARLDARLIRFAGDLSRAPHLSLCQLSGSWSQTKAGYNFLSNPKVRPETISQPHVDRTIERMQAERRVLVACDISALEYTGRRVGDDLGFTYRKDKRGLMFITALAISTAGEPLGLIGQQSWVRPLGDLGKNAAHKQVPTSGKQSQRWLDLCDGVSAAVSAGSRPAAPQLVIIADREADFYDFFASARPANVEVLIRATQNRRLSDQSVGVKEAIAAATPAGTHTITIGRAGERAARAATLTVRYTRVSVCKPRGKGALSPAETVSVTLVQVREETPPPGVTPIEWLLLSSLPVTSIQEALQLVDYYGHRWLIERFHYVLKSGLKIEQRQLQSRHSIENALAVMSIIAWHLMALMYRARLRPDDSCAAMLTSEQWQLLSLKYTGALATPPPSLKQAVRWIAMLGGFLGRTRDGDPGVKTLWQGLSVLNQMTEALALARSSPILMGKA
jgi:hypothetical protein